MVNKKIDDIYELLRKTLYSYELYKQLVPYFMESMNVCVIQEREFWTHVSDNCIQIAAVHWTKVFGSRLRGENKTHFTQLIEETRFNMYLVDYGIDFSSTCNEMSRFRDKYVAHKDNSIFEVPRFDDAITIIHKFDSLVRDSYKEMEWEAIPRLVKIQEGYRISISDYLCEKGIVQPIWIHD